MLVLITVCGGLCCNTAAQTRNGVPPFGTAAGGPDTINLANLNVDLNAPIRNKPGRGTNFTYALNYVPLFGRRSPRAEPLPGNRHLSGLEWPAACGHVLRDLFDGLHLWPLWVYGAKQLRGMAI